MARRSYAIRTNDVGTTDKKYRQFMISIPREIAELLPSGVEYVPELTDEGILFRPVTVPDWAKES